MIDKYNENIPNHWVAALVRIEECVLAGQIYEEAKRETINAIMKSFYGSGEEKKFLLKMMQDITPADFSKATIRTLDDQFIKRYEKHSGRKVGFIGRHFYYLTGIILA
jgi:hypothetical protein